MRKGWRLFFKLLLLFILLIILVLASMIAYFEQDLPDVNTLKTVKMQEPLRVYASDGQLMAEFGESRRIPVSLNQVPKLLIEGLIATEDQRFYENPGVDFWGLARASTVLLATGKKVQGGSTITMQVARNFFLTRQKTFSRKIREILLSLKISRELSKDKVLELYLNQVYLGNRAYGVGAAAEVYYGKSLNQLTLGEMAMIAGLPKAPSAINPLADPIAAKERRRHVLERMLELHYITEKQFKEANREPITTEYHQTNVTVDAPYAAEAVRDQMVAQYGDDAYTLGLKVYTTIDPRLQAAANSALRRAVINYDIRHGYRGPIANWGHYNLGELASWQRRLSNIPDINDLDSAVVLSVAEQQATALLDSGETITISWPGLSWARKQLDNGGLGQQPTMASDVVKAGDVICVQKRAGEWFLAQVPQVQGALVALNPSNGATLAMVGGFSFDSSHFNRVYQAQRQPGSSFKPFVYAAALSKGFTLATIVNDAPFVAVGPDGSEWRPQNDNGKFMGPVRVRVALMRSINMVSIRLLQMTGLNYVLNYLKNFGFNPDNLPHNLTLALGSGEVTPIQMADAYSVFANGGYKISDYLIDHVTDSAGKILFQAQPLQACEACLIDPAVNIPNPAPRTISPQIAYLMTSALQTNIQGQAGMPGTGGAAKVLNRTDIGGKTGTTNDQRDGWFDGFNSDVVTITWMGFDNQQPLYEYGAQAALPMWIDFMRAALAGKPLHTMPRPPGLVSVRINPTTGEPASPGERNAIFETFIPKTLSNNIAPAIAQPVAAASSNVPVVEAQPINQAPPAKQADSVYGGLY